MYSAYCVHCYSFFFDKICFILSLALALRQAENCYWASARARKKQEYSESN